MTTTLRPAPPRRRPTARHRLRRWVALGLLALLVLLVADLVRAVTWSEGPLAVKRLAPAFVRLPGKAPKVAWPSEGQAAVAVEGVGRFGASGHQRPQPIASVAKVMTAYLVLREHPLAPGAQGFRIRISQADVEEERQRVALDQSTVEVKKGELLSERQALEALMLPSANNVAALLAAHEAGSIPAFVARMNRAARRLGMRSTTYTDPSGFDEGTVSTAWDQVKLARVAMADPTFARIVALPAAHLPVAGEVANYNGLVGANGYVGIKTGSDDAAGGCLLFAKRLSVGGRSLTLLGAVLGQRDGELVDAALASADALADSVAAGLRVRTALPAGTPVLRQTNVAGEGTVAVAARPLREIGWPGMRMQLGVAALPAGGEAGAGERAATVTVHGPRLERGPAVVTRSLGRPPLGWRLLHPF